MPPAPCTIGSTMTAATSSPARSRIASSAASAAATSPLAGRHRCPQNLEQQLREGAVEDRIAAGRHRAEGVAVVARGRARRRCGAALRRAGATAGCAIFIATSTAVEPSSEKKTRVRPAGRERRARGQARRRLVGEAGEDHLLERGRLLARAAFSRGWSWPRRFDPPGRDAVEDSPAVGELQPDPFGAHHRQRRRRGLHLGVGMPDVRPVQGEPVGAGTRRPHRGRRPRHGRPLGSIHGSRETSYEPCHVFIQYGEMWDALSAAKRIDRVPNPPPGSDATRPMRCAPLTASCLGRLQIAAQLAVRVERGGGGPESCRC